MKKVLSHFLMVLLMSFFVNSANALMVTTTVEGQVTLDNSGDNPFGLSVLDSISLSVTYDDASITGMSTDEKHFVDANTDWDFNMTLGSYSFTQSDVTDPSYTAFYFNQGDFDGIEFYLDPVDIGNYTDLVIEDYNGGRSLFAEHTSFSPVYLEADWDFTTAKTIPAGSDSIAVSEPPVLLLMLSGLFGLAITKRFRQ